MNHKTSCIIPAYNETERIGNLIKELLPIDLLTEIIVINDGSTDDTLDQIKKYEGDPKLRIINFEKNKGKGYALAEGILAAEHDLIVLIDADMKGFNRENVGRLIDELVEKENDLVLASPYDTSSLMGVWQSYTMPLGMQIMGIRALWKKDIVPIIEEIREARYGVEVVTFNDYLKKNKKIKPIILKGIRATYKFEKEIQKGEKAKVVAFFEGMYKELKMMRQVAKSTIEYPPLPSFRKFREGIRHALTPYPDIDETFAYIDQEADRQLEGLELIPSENYVSDAVLEALGSILTNKYSEGYPDKRYYGGNKYIDMVEKLAQKRALEVFGLDKESWGVNVQPYSGSPANHAVYFGLLEKGDTVMGLSLPSGGHLTHGWKVNFSAKYYNSVQYSVKPNGQFDYDEILALAKEHKPKLIWAGATAYSRNYDYKKFKEIADEVGAYLAADIAHVAGLIAAGVHNSPFPYADVVTTTTHKTLRGPRGAMIFARTDLLAKINSAVFPGLQGGPHNHQTAAISVALGEALKPEFKEYGAQIVKNAKALAKGLMGRGIKVVGGDTENHLMLLDFSDFGGGSQVELALEIANITVNKNTIPNDPNSPYYPSGVRIGTPALTSRGMKEEDMDNVANWIARVVEVVKEYELPEGKEEKRELMKTLKEILPENEELLAIKEEVKDFSLQFPIPGITE